MKKAIALKDIPYSKFWGRRSGNLIIKGKIYNYEDSFNSMLISTEERDVFVPFSDKAFKNDFKIIDEKMEIRINIVEVCTDLAASDVEQFFYTHDESPFVVDEKGDTSYTEVAQQTFDAFYDGYYKVLSSSAIEDNKVTITGNGNTVIQQK